jgi:hypothetical protein
VTLDIDTSHALRTHDQLVELVRAVERASLDDESRSVEWKSGYTDVTSTEASFAIARAILGLSNRPVDVSKATFEGGGYVLIGAEPNSLQGQAVPDSAELLNAVRRFTGHGRPLWDPRSVTVDGKNVLIITVEPPRTGDRIALLHKSFQPRKGPLVEEGTVFVRQPGATERASRADMEMLQDRLLSGSEADAVAARVADREEKMRHLVADMVHAANQWADTMQILVTMTGGDRWSQRDWVEWVNTDSGRAMATNAQLIGQNARQLRLLTNEQSLLEPLRKAQDLLANGASAFDGVHSRHPSHGADRSKAYAHINHVKQAFHAVEVAAVEILSAPPARRPG